MDEATQRLHDAIRRAVVAVCERYGYGATIDIAASEWATKRTMNRAQMAIWLRSLADEMDGGDAAAEAFVVGHGKAVDRG